LEEGIYFLSNESINLIFGGIVHDNLLRVMICNFDINLIGIIFVKLNMYVQGNWRERCKIQSAILWYMSLRSSHVEE